MRLSTSAALLFLTGLLLAGCSTIPAGNAPAGAVTDNPSGNERLSEREAVSRIVTEITVLKLSGRLGPVSEVRTSGEPRPLLLAAARELSANNLLRDPKGSPLTLHGTLDHHHLLIQILSDSRELSRLPIQLR